MPLKKPKKGGKPPFFCVLKTIYLMRTGLQLTQAINLAVLIVF
jgi:hypothetical protein